MKYTDRREAGFALVELLVVLAVVAMLATLFFVPALGRAKQHAQDAQCLNNLKHLTEGWLMYTADNKGFLPGNGDEGNSSIPQWCPGRMDSGGAPINTAYIKAGQIYPYVGSPSFYRCPADTSTYNGTSVYPLGGPGNPRVRSVSMNAWMSPPLDNDVGLPTTIYRAYDKESDLAVPGPANLYLLIDENPYTINDGFFWEQPKGAANPPTATSWIDYPANYHNGAGGLSFCDGHAQMRKWTDPVLFKVMFNPPATPPYTDLLWLLQRTTAHR